MARNECYLYEYNVHKNENKTENLGFEIKELVCDFKFELLQGKKSNVWKINKT